MTTPRTLQLSLLLLLGGAAGAPAQEPLRVIFIGGHPDDCDIKAGGVAAKYAAAGHKVKFVAVTNGDAGHQDTGGGALARRRMGESREAARRLGIEYDVLDNHDAELLPTLPVRQSLIRLIRQWRADVVVTHRPGDYHPDHRYTGIAVQDAAYMVVVPNVVPDTAPLRRNPVFLYFADPFERPQPFRPDVVVSIDDVAEKKLDGLDAHASQFYEWLPWVDGEVQKVPPPGPERRRWMAEKWLPPVPEAWKASLARWYGAQAAPVKHAEAFEVSEYGTRPTEADLRRLFPFFPPAPPPAR
jgi:LmbE family N-acetylglucosaminyl deacetylase